MAITHNTRIGRTIAVPEKYDVEIIVNGKSFGTYRVEAAKESTARSEGLLSAFRDGLKLGGARVDYMVNGKPSFMNC